MREELLMFGRTIGKSKRIVAAVLVGAVLGVLGYFPGLESSPNAEAVMSPSSVTVSRDSSGTVVTASAISFTANPGDSLSFSTSCFTPGFTFLRLVYVSGPGPINVPSNLPIEFTPNPATTRTPGQVLADTFTSLSFSVTFPAAGTYTFQAFGLFGPVSNTVTLVVTTCELSGPNWVNRFPGSKSTNDLVEPFRTNVNNFLGALDAAGASVAITQTYRPPQRAYLMHWAWMIAREGQAPGNVPAFPGATAAERSVPAYRGPDTVNICWVHTDQAGNPDISASVSAAQQMVEGYGIVFQPALHSEHSLGTAIDMNIAWRGSLKILDANGNLIHIHTKPRTGMNPDLWAVGKTYGVIKLATDPPHWSIDGH